MSERVHATKKRARKQTRDESFEAGLEAMYNRNRGRLVALAKAESKGTPEWQKNVALATNTAGALAGPAAVYMAVRQARSKKGGMPRAGVEAVEAKSKPTTRLGRAARATGKVMRNPKAIAAGGAVAIGAQVANTSGDVIAARFLAEDKKKGKSTVNKASDPRDPKSYKKAIHYVTPEQGESYKAGVHRLADKQGKKVGTTGAVLGAATGSSAAAYLLRKGPKKVVIPTAIGAGAIMATTLGTEGRKSARNSVYNTRRFEGKRLDGKPVRNAMSNVGKRMSGEEKALIASGGVGGAAGAFVGAGVQRNGRKLKDAYNFSRTIDPASIAQAKAMYGDKYLKELKRQFDAGKPRQLKVRGMKFNEARRIMGTSTAADLKAKGMAANARGVLRRNGKGALIGGVLGTGLGLSSMTKDSVNKSIEQSLISKSDAVVITGHGNSLVEKRNFNAEADRQRRLGLYAGAGLGAGAVLGDAARRRMPRVEEELKDGRKIKRFDMPKGRRGRLTLAALAGGAVLGAGGGAGAYRRGISERNNTYM